MTIEELFHKIYGILIEKRQFQTFLNNIRDSRLHDKIEKKRRTMVRWFQKKGFALLNIEHHKNVMRQIFGKINL